MVRRTVDPDPSVAKGRPWRICKFRAINADGTLLWPDHNDLRSYQNLVASGSSALFNSVYQQDPSGLAGAVFRPEWWREFCFADYTETVPDAEGMRTRTLNAAQLLANGFVQRVVENPAQLIPLQAHDLALSQKQVADFYARSNVLCERTGDFFVIDCFQAHLTDLQMLADIGTAAARKPRPRAIGIESNNFQRLLTLQAKREFRMLPLIELDPAGLDKVTRAQPLAAHMERGRVFFLRNAPWAASLRFELQAFPGGVHDDRTDSLSYAFELATKYAFGSGAADALRLQQALRREGRPDEPLGSAFR